MKTNLKYWLLVTFFFVGTTLSPLGMFAQVSPSELEYPYNHLPWYTIEGDHFMIHYQGGNEKTALAASHIAHQVYEPITGLYDFEPERKVSIVLRDREDYSNGAAYFFDDKIDIWVPPLDTPLRGNHQWLRNVITHEFTHIVQLGASMKRSRLVPAIYLQWLSYEDVRRPDVLYGSPKVIITMPFSTVSIPSWFAEGTAQYQRQYIFNDYWDSHRDMIIRTAILNDNYLGFVGMGFFSSKTSLEREMIYNQGFDFINYLAGRFGEQVIADITHASSETGKGNFNKVIERATGISGEQLFDDWIQDRKKIYTEQINEVGPFSTTSIEENGFLNFYPQFDNRGETLAYLTNRGRDFGRTRLILKSHGTTQTIDELGGSDFLDSDQNFSFSHDLQSNATIDFISSRFSFSPDGKKVAYSKSEKNRFGEVYQDLYLYDIATQGHQKITTDARLQDPSWHPEKDEIAAVKLKDGTQNLVLLKVDSAEEIKLTDFELGETVYTPVWSPSGEQIYFSMASTGNRNIYRYHLDSREEAPVFESDLVDFRDPWIDPSTQFLYFSSDADGIFNIYRKNLEDNKIQKITDVHGGAFMPFAANDSLYFSEYKAGGYKISAIALPEFSETHSHEELLKNPDSDSRVIPAKEIRINDSPYTAIEDIFLRSDSLTATEKQEQFTIKSSDSSVQSYTHQPYNQTTTGLSITPVVRFDNYSKLKGSNSKLIQRGRFGNVGKNLVRDFKAGAYFSSRDVTESLSIFAGALFGWGSIGADNLSDFFSPNRINNLDRDLFFIVEHRGMPFIKRSWSPTVGVELYNLKRNVRDGLGIEEFPCTSCLPVQKSVDIRYNVWQADLYLQSKLNRWSLFELRASYSPYSVSTDGFFSEEFREFISGSTTEYFKGTSYSASYIADLIIPSRNSDIAPEGWETTTTFRLERGRLLQQFEIDEGTLSPVYSQTTNYSLELKNRLGFSLTGNINGLVTSRTFAYFNSPDDYFYLDYAGGLTGMRSYPYFAIGGHKTAFGRFSLLAPIKQDINHQLGAYTFDKLYAHLFFEVGNGWGGPLQIGNHIKSGMGAELRLALNRNYLYPLKFFVNTTYGFNRFNITLPKQFISTSSGNSVNYGREILFYFGLTFDFNQF